MKKLLYLVVFLTSGLISHAQTSNDSNKKKEHFKRSFSFNQIYLLNFDQAPFDVKKNNGFKALTDYKIRSFNTGQYYVDGKFSGVPFSQFGAYQTPYHLKQDNIYMYKKK
jgi:hypothetical protein